MMIIAPSEVVCQVIGCDSGSNIGKTYGMNTSAVTELLIDLMSMTTKLCKLVNGLMNTIRST